MQKRALTNVKNFWRTTPLSSCSSLEPTRVAMGCGDQLMNPLVASWLMAFSSLPMGTTSGGSMAVNISRVNPTVLENHQQFADVWDMSHNGCSQLQAQVPHPVSWAHKHLGGRQQGRSWGWDYEGGRQEGGGILLHGSVVPCWWVG